MMPLWQDLMISIHPPRVGWDQCVAVPRLCRNYFNPPTPCGVGRHDDGGAYLDVNFNPPTPCGVGRCRENEDKPAYDISIHPPRVGWDRHTGGFSG